jgi:hypothetical protein
MDPTKGYLTNGSRLTIHCQIFPKVDEDWKHIKVDQPSAHARALKGSKFLGEQLKTLIDDPEYSDVTLATPGKSFLVNKSILSGKLTKSN